MKRILLAALVLGGCSQAGPELHVVNWSDYFAPDTISNFEREFGCRVKLDYIESSETLRAKLERAPSGYDVAFPSDEVMPELIATGKLEKLDHAKLPNTANLSKKFLDLAYDRKNEHSVPYLWGTTGIAYTKKHVEKAPDSWSALWDPKYARHVTVLDDPREALAAAMWACGDSPENPTAESIERAKAKFTELKLLAYDSALKTRLIQGEAWIGQCFSGDAFQAGTADERSADIGYVIPKEGGTLWFDNIVVPKGAPQRELAHQFINYLLRPDVSAAITNAVQYANPNDKAAPGMDPAILKNPMIYPDEETLKRCLLLQDPPPDIKKRLLAAWAEVKGR